MSLPPSTSCTRTRVFLRTLEASTALPSDVNLVIVPVLLVVVVREQGARD